MPYNWFSWNQSIIPTRNNFGGVTFVPGGSDVMWIWWIKTFKVILFSFEYSRNQYYDKSTLTVARPIANSGQNPEKN